MRYRGQGAVFSYSHLLRRSLAVLSVIVLPSCAIDSLGPPTPGAGSAAEDDTSDDSPAPGPGAPWAEAGPLILTEVDGVQLDASGSGDPDGDPIDYSWTQSFGPEAEVHGAFEVDPWITLSGPGLYVFELSVTDGTDVARDEVMVAYEPPAEQRFVLHLSVDGIRPDMIDALGPDRAPTFHALQAGGAFTHDARTDADHTLTLPNHASQLTGRPVDGDEGHAWTLNGLIGLDTIHDNKEAYVTSVFDVVHDHGMRTAMFAGKSKFALFEDSYGAGAGAPDTEGADDGKRKIDYVLIETDMEARVDALLANLEAAPHHYTFFHFADPDRTGHLDGWDAEPDSEYAAAVEQVDAALARIVLGIVNHPLMAGRTTLLLTSDHGGDGAGHTNSTVYENMRIPFYAWGPGVEPGADLYGLNADRRTHPGEGAPAQDADPPPIRNADVANAACHQLGLPSIPGSVINADEDEQLQFSGG